MGTSPGHEANLPERLAMSADRQSVQCIDQGTDFTARGWLIAMDGR